MYLTAPDRAEESKSVSMKPKAAVCPESTIESANRRNFIRKAGLLSAGAIAGATVVRGVLPQSTAASNISITACNAYVKTASICNAYARTLCACGIYGQCIKTSLLSSSGSLVIDCTGQNNGTMLEMCLLPCKPHALLFGSRILCPRCPGCCASFNPGQGIGSNQVPCNPNAFGLDLYTNYQKRLSITNCGFVGIGNANPSTTLSVNGGVSAKVAITTGPYSAGPTDFMILADASSAALTITLPAASNTGMFLVVKKIDSSSNVITIAPFGTDTIEGLTSKMLESQYHSLTLVAGGNGVWYILSRGV
jgi:hypothetical protein